MDHNLEDSLNLDGAMETIDFDHSATVVNQADISPEASGPEGDLPMEFEEQQILIDSGNEEIIVSDFMGDQFTLQEYGQDNQMVESTAAVEMDQIRVMTSQSDTIIDLDLESESIPQSFKQDISQQSQFIAVKAAPHRVFSKKSEPASLPRQVAIAPKPPKMAQGSAPGKPFAVGPRPIALVVNKNYKKLPLSNVQPGKGNTVLAQVGKQVYMLPAGVGAGHKIKLVSGAPPHSDQAQLISTKAISELQSSKPGMTKVIVQAGQSCTELSNQPAVITKLCAGGAAHKRYLMHQKTVPISLGGNRVTLTPTQQGMKFATKQQIVAMKSPQKIAVAPQATTTKKVIMPANPKQNVILKTTAPSNARVSKDGIVVKQLRGSQLHQINIPGKGIQYIRLLTNPAASPPTPPPAAPATPATPAPPAAAPEPPHSFLVTDTIGNVIQMTAQKMVSGQPPPLILTGSIEGTQKVPSKPERKLVRIAPVTSKPAQTVARTVVRSLKSLLAPRPAAPAAPTAPATPAAPRTDAAPDPEGGVAVRALIADRVTDEDRVEDVIDMHEVEVEFVGEQSSDVEENSSHHKEFNEEDHPLIVVPPHYMPDKNPYPDIENYKDTSYSDEDSRSPSPDDAKTMSNSVNVEAEIVPYQSPNTPPELVDIGDLVTDMGMRPRKACNCTKSQCLKLYCDCFANGEFCNNCNCNNCHNNLENEELRQKAIRACLERNPNAFRPKIGKAKLGGPEIIRRHNKGCNCKRSGCLKNYCECYEARIACTAMCKCVGCRNVEDGLERRRDVRRRHTLAGAGLRAHPHSHLAASQDHTKQPCSFMTSEVIEAVCQCLIAAAVEGDEEDEADVEVEDVEGGAGTRDVIEEFARCLQEIIGASHQAPLLLDEGHA